MDTAADASQAGSTGGFEKALKLSQRGILVASLIGGLVVLALCCGQFSSLCEYPAIYDGARLVGTPYLYDAAHNRQEQIRDVGGYGAFLSYGRLPYYAALVWPLGQLPYQKSLIVWDVFSAVALLAFVMLWPVTQWRMTLLACAWSIPVALVFFYAEDDLWLLVVIAVLFRWYRSRPFVAGLLASLLSIKFHLFLLLPLLLIRRWRLAGGFAIGCAVLIAVSFAVGGLNWPAEMAHVLSSPAIVSREYVMPNVRGFLSPFTNRLIPEILLDLVIAGIVFRVVRRTDFQFGMAAVLVGSLLVSHHAGLEDCVVLIPALLVIGERSQ